MPDHIEILPCGPIEGRIRPPGSKSITNRALVCAALAHGDSTLEGALESEDTRVMAGGLRRLGIDVAAEPGGAAIRVKGCTGRIGARHLRVSAKLFCANSGTTVRFLTAVATLGHGTFRLEGTARMHERPIGDLLDALAQLGAFATSERRNGCPPVVVDGAGLTGGTATIRGDLSSQFLSALLMVAPYAAQPVELVVDGPLVSQPYVRMTLAVMEAFGVPAEAGDLARIYIPQGRYVGRTYSIEPDASAASYFFAAAAITGGRVVVDGLSKNSLQGDIAFCDCLAQMGCAVEYGASEIAVAGSPLRGIDVDMNAISDTVQTLAVVALFADGPTTIRGVGHIRHKETDRIGNLAIELRKLGASVEELPNGLRIIPRKSQIAAIDTYDDHRMAMSFALAGLRIPGVVINDPGCTAKTYPHFFDDLERLAAPARA
jgi:3-phosphoshikimate 1-carboxyvinyltransferase